MVHPVSARRVHPAALSLAFALATPAFAADSAIFNPLGYSGDFRYFAFEQAGQQDGSGFPYADLFIIDLQADSFAGGSPFRVRIDNDRESVPVVEAQAQVRAEAEQALEELDIVAPARIVALLGDGEWGADDQTLSFSMPTYGLTPPTGSYQIALETFPLPTVGDCESMFGEQPAGFALTLTVDGKAREVHRDETVPGSRNCVITYKAYAVMMPLWSGDVEDAVAIISVHSWGFEGADRRFIALPLGHADRP